MHPQWDDPLKLEGSARAEAREQAGPEGPPPIPPTPPRVSAEWHGDELRLRYEVFPTHDGWPDGLVVTVNSPDEAESPTTERFAIKKHRGAVEIRTRVDPSHRYDLFASVATPNQLASESVRVDLCAQGTQRWTRQHDRGLYLAVRNRPVGPQELGCALA